MDSKCFHNFNLTVVVLVCARGFQSIIYTHTITQLRLIRDEVIPIDTIFAGNFLHFRYIKAISCVGSLIVLLYKKTSCFRFLHLFNYISRYIL